MNLFALLLSVFLAAAPGAWLAFTLAGASTPFSTRLGLAIALSPFVVGAQVLALTALTTDFAAASALTVLLNVPAALLIWRGRAKILAPGTWLVPGFCFLVIAGGLIALWLGEPGLRIYSWHNMMQAETVYQVARLPAWPEEMGLAGERLNYAWFGHVQVAAVALLADASPFTVFPALNIAALLAFMLLMYDVVRRFVGDRPVIVSLTTLTLLLTPNLAGVLLHYVQALGGAGDIRLSTPLHKFLHFDLMTNGLALFGGAMLLAIRAIEDGAARLRALLIACLVAMAVVYPLLLPAGLIVAAAAFVAPTFADWWSGRGLHISRALMLNLAALAVPVLVGIVYLRLLGDGSASVAASVVDPWQMRTRVAEGALRAGGLWLPLLIPAAWRTWKTRDPRRLALFAASAPLAAMFVVLELPIQVQYKFLVAALLCVLPLAAEQAVIWLDRLGRFAPAAAALIACLALIADSPHIMVQHVPWTTLPRAEPIDESHFAVAPMSKRLRWTEAVRLQTPRATIVVHPPLEAPIEVFTQRPAYASLGLGDTQRPGYTMREREMLEAVKGYPSTLLDHRGDVLAALYGDAPADMEALDAEFAALQRPVAFYLPRPNAYLQTLEDAGRGHAVFADSEAVVWLVDPMTEMGQ